MAMCKDVLAAGATAPHNHRVKGAVTSDEQDQRVQLTSKGGGGEVETKGELLAHRRKVDNEEDERGSPDRLTRCLEAGENPCTPHHRRTKMRSWLGNLKVHLGP
jgi:hypothetical protein